MAGAAPAVRNCSDQSYLRWQNPGKTRRGCGPGSGLLLGLMRTRCAVPEGLGGGAAAQTQRSGVLCTAEHGEGVVMVQRRRLQGEVDAQETASSGLRRGWGSWAGVPRLEGRARITELTSATRRKRIASNVSA